jgi:hypothetical protein
MAGRTLAGFLATLAGVAGVAVASQLERNGYDSGLLAAVMTLVLAVGILLLASRGRPAALRIAGGLLAVSGVAVIVTHHQMWYWLPASWEAPMSLASLTVAVTGLATVMLGRGFNLGGLSATLGLLALLSLALTLLELPDVGSWDRDVLRVWATGLGAVALAAAFLAVARRQTTQPRWRGYSATVALVGAAVVVFAAADSYDQYAPTGYRAALFIGAGVAILLTMAFGLAAVAPIRRPETQVRPPTTESRRADRELEPAIVAEPAPSFGTAIPDLGARPPSGAADLATTATRQGRIQTVALVVGLVTGIITIVKELVALVLAIFG